MITNNKLLKINTIQELNIKYFNGIVNVTYKNDKIKNKIRYFIYIICLLITIQSLNSIYNAFNKNTKDYIYEIIPLNIITVDLTKNNDLFYSFIEITAKEHNINEIIVMAMILTEVGESLPRNPKSYNPNDYGMAQINKILIPQMKQDNWIGEHFDPLIPEHAVLAATKQIKWLLDRKGVNENNISFAYNMGIGAIWDNREPNKISLEHNKRYKDWYKKIENNKNYYINLFNTVLDWRY